MLGFVRQKLCKEFDIKQYKSTLLHNCCIIVVRISSRPRLFVATKSGTEFQRLSHILMHEYEWADRRMDWMVMQWQNINIIVMEQVASDRLMHDEKFVGVPTWL